MMMKMMIEIASDATHLLQIPVDDLMTMIMRSILMQHSIDELSHRRAASGGSETIDATQSSRAAIVVLA